MNKTNNKTYFFEDRPLFGMDIGRGSLRVMQLDTSRSLPGLKGYGVTTFDPSAVVEGVIEKPEIIAAAAVDLFRHHLVGDITTKRVVVDVPTSRAFTRTLQLPQMNSKDIAEAIRTEAEQYIPMHTEDLYIDYSPLRTENDTTEYFLVAMPKKIVDSYLAFTRMLGLEAVSLQTSTGAGAALFAHDTQSDVPAVLIDFGSESADITIFDAGQVVTGTVDCGGETITRLIGQALSVTPREAAIIKTKYGLSLSKKQKQIEAALTPVLEPLLKEIRRTIRYHEERYQAKRTIGQVVILGGGANMPGLADYLTNNLRLAVRAFDPTPYIDFGHLQPFSKTDRMSFATVTGLAIVNPQEVFAA